MVEWDPAVQHAVRARLGAAEADAFLARLEVLSPDILEPLGQVYGAVTDTGSSPPSWCGTRCRRGRPAGAAAAARPAPRDRPGLVPARRG